MDKKTNKDSLSFLEHLAELRWHLVRSAISVIVFAIAAFLSKDFIFNEVILSLTEPDFFSYRAICWATSQFGDGVFCFETMPFEIINMKMSGQFSMHIRVSFISGFVLAFPYIVYEMWKFVKPGLKENEKKYSRYVIMSSSVLFTVGVLFGYFVISPLSIQFLGSYSVSDSVMNRLDLTSYISTVTSITMAAGILFELPIVVYFLSKLGLIGPNLMRGYRKHALVIILILSAIITPPDIASQILVSIPVLILYEISIWISSRIVASNKVSEV